MNPIKFVTVFCPPAHSGCPVPRITQCEASHKWWVGQESDSPPQTLNIQVDDYGFCDNYAVGENAVIEARFQRLRHNKIRIETTTITLPNGDEFGVVSFKE